MQRVKLRPKVDRLEANAYNDAGCEQMPENRELILWAPCFHKGGASTSSSIITDRVT